MFADISSSVVKEAFRTKTGIFLRGNKNHHTKNTKITMSERGNVLTFCT